jgi:hypothetical protein
MPSCCRVSMPPTRGASIVHPVSTRSECAANSSPRQPLRRAWHTPEAAWAHRLDRLHAAIMDALPSAAGRPKTRCRKLSRGALR